MSLCWATVFFLFYSWIKTRGMLQVFLISSPSALSIVCTDVQHHYLGKSYVVLLVMTLVPRWFIDTFSWRISSHLLFSSADHPTLSFLTNSDFWGKSSHLLTSHSQFQGLGCCLELRWLIEAGKVGWLDIFSRERGFAG